MEDEVLLVSDGDGLAFFGGHGAVKRYLQSIDQWKKSKVFGLNRLEELLGSASITLQGASAWSAESGRWIKLTKESAQLVQEHGLMDSKVPGVSHVMIGKPGVIGKWLQAEHGVGALMSNPALLEGVAGVMAQLANQQAVASISNYLDAIDVKADRVLRKLDDAAVSKVIGAAFAIDEAMAVRASTGVVSEVTWSKIVGISETLKTAIGHALRQLEGVAKEIEQADTVKKAAEAVGQVESACETWLVVLARCVQLQHQLHDLELDRVLAAAPETLDGHRDGVQSYRRDREVDIEKCALFLLDRIEQACELANERKVGQMERSLQIITTGNDVAMRVCGFLEALGIPAVLRSWESRPLDRRTEVVARAIQGARNNGPQIVGIVLATGAAGLCVANTSKSEEQSDSEDASTAA